MTDATTRDAEPSMDDILSSIRRMISDDRSGPANGVGASAERAQDAAGPADEETEDGRGEAAAPTPSDPLAMIGAVAPVADGPDDDDDGADAAGTQSAAGGAFSGGLIAEATAAATLASIEALTREVRVHHGDQGRTLEEIVETLLRPILKEWLDRHLPEIVAAKVEAEIRRIAARRGD